MTDQINANESASLQLVPYSYNIGTRKEYLCRMCFKCFNSKFGFHRHVIKAHKATCYDCSLDFKNWNQFKAHLPHCARKFGITTIRPRQNSRPVKKPKLKFECQLCKRKYEKAEHLRNHQINRCKKRYVTDTWVVKI
jgi:hypothetical protein